MDTGIMVRKMALADDTAKHALASIAELLGVAIPAKQTLKDPQCQKLVDAQWIADCLELIEKSLKALLDAPPQDTKSVNPKKGK